MLAGSWGLSPRTSFQRNNNSNKIRVILKQTRKNWSSFSNLRHSEERVKRFVPRGLKHLLSRRTFQVRITRANHGTPGKVVSDITQLLGARLAPLWTFLLHHPSASLAVPCGGSHRLHTSPRHRPHSLSISPSLGSARPNYHIDSPVSQSSDISLFDLFRPYSLDKATLSKPHLTLRIVKGPAPSVSHISSSDLASALSNKKYCQIDSTSARTDLIQASAPSLPALP